MREPMLKLRRSRLVAACVAMAALAACTSVSRTAVSTSDTSAGLDGGSAIGGGSAAEVGSGEGLAAPGAGEQAGSVTGPAGGSASGDGSAAGGGSGSDAPASASCRTPVKVGVSHSSDRGAAAVSFGAGGSISEEQANQYDRSQMEANRRMAEWVSANGGLGPGCPVVVSFHDYHTINSGGHPAETQAECTAFAQDQKVHIAFPQHFETGLLIPCLAKAGIVTFFDSPNYVPSPQDFAKYRGFLYQGKAMTSYRWGPFIDLLKQYGYFDTNASGAKVSQPTVGILLTDQGDGHNQDLVNKLWLPALNKHGIKAVVYTWSPSRDPASQFNAAVLEFRRAGVQHVMFTPDGGASLIFFPPSAEAQQFRPRYAITTANSPAAWILVPPAQQANAMVVSYDPFDVVSASGPAEYDRHGGNPQKQAKCAAIFRDGKIQLDQQTLNGICDRFFLLQDALKGQPAVNPQTLLAGMDALGSRYAPAHGYTNLSFGPPHHYDGVNAVRALKWNPPTNSFVFASPKVTIARAG